MLAARGVSLGLGGRINLSELNHLPRDKLMLGKLNRMKREQKAEQKAQQSRLVVRKHVDSRTLWTACANVIVGTAIIALGLVMTVIGYFDSTDLIADPKSSDQVGGDSGDWLRHAMKSMQYVGPVFCGIGMFLMIIACVITLESRDRHAQIIQEESTELRRSRRQQTQRMNELDGTSTAPEAIRENGLTAYPFRGRQVAQQMQQGQLFATTDPLRDVIEDASDHHRHQHANNPSSVQLLTPRFNSTVTTSDPPDIPPLSELSLSEASSTDAMQEYTFPARKSVEEELKRRRRARQNEEVKEEEKEEDEEELKEGEEDGAVPGEQPRKGSVVGLRRKSTSAIIQTVNRHRMPEGKAPLVRVESVVELSLSVSGSPPPRLETPNRRPKC